MQGYFSPVNVYVDIGNFLRQRTVAGLWICFRYLSMQIRIRDYSHTSSHSSPLPYWSAYSIIKPFLATVQRNARTLPTYPELQPLTFRPFPTAPGGTVHSPLRSPSLSLICPFYRRDLRPIRKAMSRRRVLNPPSHDLLHQSYTIDIKIRHACCGTEGGVRIACTIGSAEESGEVRARGRVNKT